MHTLEALVEIENHIKILAKEHERETLNGVSLLYLVNCSFLLTYVKELIARNKDLENEIINLNSDAQHDRMLETR
jgi:hypothetical protein